MRKQSKYGGEFRIALRDNGGSNYRPVDGHSYKLYSAPRGKYFLDDELDEPYLIDGILLYDTKVI